MKLTKRILALLLAAVLVLAVAPAAVAEGSGYTDVQEEDWFRESVDYVTEKGIMKGVGNNTFAPDAITTRAMVVTTLYRFLEHDVTWENPFPDVAGDTWYTQAVAWAANAGVAKGYPDGTFKPNRAVTREELVTLLYRFALYTEMDTSAKYEALGIFGDGEHISGFAWEAMEWAVGESIIVGRAQGLLVPQGTATRAELAAMLMRLCLPLWGRTVVLHTNDVHGAIEGYAKVAGVKKTLEGDGAEVVLVDAGDFSQGTTYVSTTKGMDAVTMMNATGYDIVTLGNHEFDYGYEALTANMAAAEFEVICADVLDESGLPIFAPSTVYTTASGLRIGFIGLETPEAQTKANPALIQGLTFLAEEELYACAQAQADQLQKESDLVIALAHLGVDGESEPNRSVDLYANTTGIDFIIDGHSHTVMTEGPQGEPIQSTGTAMQNLGYIVINNVTGQIEYNDLLDLTTENIPVDEDVAAAAQAIIDRVLAEYGAVFAKTEVRLNGDRDPGNRTQETNLGDLITDAMLWSVRKDAGSIHVPAENVVAITNGGGIRATIEAGDITKNDVNTVLPFGNTVAVVYVTGTELLEALEASTYCTPTAVGAFPQVSGISFTVDTTKEYDAEEETYPGSTYYGPASINRVTIDSVNGQAFDAEATYAVVTNNFLAAGGDTYYAFASATDQFDTGLPLDEVLMDYITQELEGVVGKDYAGPQGRITVLRYATETCAVPSTHRDGVSIPTYITTPAGTYTNAPVVFMLHGHGGNHNEWGGFDLVSNKLASEGFVVVTLDYPGCGASTESFQLNTMTNMKNDTLDVIHYVLETCDVDETRVGGLGYSMGGRILLEITAEELYSFDSLAFFAPAEDTEDLKGLFGGADNWEKLKAEANEKGFATFTTIYGQVQELSKAWFADLEKYQGDLAEKAAAKYDGASLVVWATDDEAVSPAVSQHVAQVFGSLTANTYANGHSYGFYGNDPYTVLVTREAPVRFFLQDLA